MRSTILLFLLAAVVGLALGGRSSAAGATTASLTPISGTAFTVHTLHLDGLPAGGSALVVLFTPSGDQTVFHPVADASGGLDLVLAPPAFGWSVGIYRVVVALSGNDATSVTFGVTNGTPQLLTDPAIPSVTSAFIITGLGFKPNAAATVDLFLTGLRGDYQFHPVADAAGNFQSIVRPEQTGMGFFPAGPYRVVSADPALTTTFSVREWPGRSLIGVPNVAVAGDSMPLTFRGYLSGRYIWGLYGSESTDSPHQFLIGPADLSGNAGATLTMPVNETGRSFVETPYDWGEVVFNVAAPTATATPSPTVTATPTGTPTATPTVVPRPAGRCARTGGSKKERAWRKKHCHR